MLIDCDSCTAGPRACGDCIVTHLLQVGPVRGSTDAPRTEDPWADPWQGSATALAGHPAPARDGRAAAPEGERERDRTAELTDSEVAAVAVLSAGGLVPPLRLVTSTRPAAPAAPSGTGRTGRTGEAGRAGRRPGRSRTG